MLPMIQNRGSKIKFQRELDVALSLRTVNDSEIEVEPGVWCIQDRSVCNVEELSPELQSFEVAQREFLLKAQICSAQAWTSHCTHAAGSERAGNWRTVGSGIEPLEPNELTGRTKRGFSPEHVWRCVAVGARPAGVGPGSIEGEDCEWKSAMELDDTAELPVSNHCVEERIQVSSPSPIAADGEFIDEIAAEYVCNVVVAGSPLGAPIV